MENSLNEGFKYIRENKQLAQPETGLPSYLNQLKQILEQSPKATPYLLPTVDPNVIEDKILGAGLIQLSEQLRNPRTENDIKKIVVGNPELHIEDIDGKIVLNAINLSAVITRYDLPPIFIHQRYVSLEPDGFNPIERFALDGIVGNEKKGFPTYLKSAGSSVPPNSNPRLRENTVPVCLYIDANEVALYRSLFTDPEGVTLTPLAKELGHSFFILGGIPASAIIGISTNEQAPVLLVRGA